MIVATRRDPARADGELLLVRDDYQSALVLPEYPNLLYALENWKSSEGILRKAWEKLCAGRENKEEELVADQLLAPLPRTWCLCTDRALTPEPNLPWLFPES